MTSSSSDVVVVGAGVVGAAIGFYLAKSGAKVTIVDRDAPGVEHPGFPSGGSMRWANDRSITTGSAAWVWTPTPSLKKNWGLGPESAGAGLSTGRHPDLKAGRRWPLWYVI